MVDAQFPLRGHTVLIVDDEVVVREVLDMIVQENGGVAYTAADGSSAIELFAKQREITCVVMDYSMPDKNGYETLCELERIRKCVPVVMISGLDIVSEVAELQRSGRVDFLPKPFGENEVIAAITKVTKNC